MLLRNYRRALYRLVKGRLRRLKNGRGGRKHYEGIVTADLRRLGKYRGLFESDKHRVITDLIGRDHYLADAILPRISGNKGLNQRRLLKEQKIRAEQCKAYKDRGHDQHEPVDMYSLLLFGDKRHII